MALELRNHFLVLVRMPRIASVCLQLARLGRGLRAQINSAYRGTADEICSRRVRLFMTPEQTFGCLAASSVWTAVRAIANCGWSRYAALTV